MASSVASMPLPAASARASTSRRKAWGVWARNTVSRAMVARIGREPPIAASPTCFTVSVTGTAAMAAPCVRAASTVRAMISAVTNGRAASWITTMSAASEVFANARATESCRRSPPATKANGLADLPSQLCEIAAR